MLLLAKESTSTRVNRDLVDQLITKSKEIEDQSRSAFWSEDQSEDEANKMYRASMDLYEAAYRQYRRARD
jgi:hypothetical protein